MDKTSKQIIQGLMNELALERQLADQLADALNQRRHGSTVPSDRIPRTHTQRIHVPGLKVGNSPESKPKKRGKRSGHPSMRWQRPDKDDKDFWTGFDL
jgi:hypothetical protein